MSVYSSACRALIGAGMLGAAAAGAVVAQQPKQTAKQAAFDRTSIPAAGKPPELRVPTWTTIKLANGAELIVSPRHNLPLVSFAINFVGGSDQFDPAGKSGVGEF